MAAIEVGEPIAWEEGDVVLSGEALHALIVANGLLDGRVFVG